MKLTTLSTLLVFLISAQLLAQERIAHTMDVAGRSSMSVKPDETT